MNTKSNRRKLITSGCSFTEPPYTWPTFLAEELYTLNTDYKWDLYNVGLGSQGNGLIRKKLIYQIEKLIKTHDPSDMFVGVMWSGVDRHHFRHSDSNLLNNEPYDGWSRNPTSVTPNNNNWYIINSHWESKHAKQWYKYFHDNTNSVIMTLEDIHYTQLYLENYGIPYFMTTYMDIFGNLGKLHELFNDEIAEDILNHPDVTYLYESINWNSFLDVGGCLEWLYENHPTNGLPDINGWYKHPTQDGHQLFTQEVIVPHLKDKMDYL